MGEPVPASDLPTAGPASGAVPPSDLPGSPAQQTAQPGQSPNALGPWASAAVRPLAKGAVGAVTFIPDLVVDITNHLGDAIESAGQAMGAKPGFMGPPLENHPKEWDSIIDKYTTQPKGIGRAAEEVSTALVSGGLAGVGKRALLRSTQLAEDAAKYAYSRITSRTAEKAVNSGYKLSPAYVGGRTTRDLQSLTGKEKVHKEFSAANEETTDRLAKSSIGLMPDNELDEHTFEMLRKEAYQPYEEARTLGQIPSDPEYETALKAAGGRFANRAGSYGGSRFEEVDKEKAAYQVPMHSAGDMIDEIRELRNLARQNLKQYNPSANAVGYTQRQIADALDGLLDRAAKKAGNPQLMDRLQAARKALARITVVEDSVGAGGHIRAKDFASMLDRGVPLDGNLRTIGETAKNFPKDVQHIAAQGKQGDLSVVDYLLGGTGLIEGSTGLTGMVLARPLTRYALRTAPVQKAMIRGMRRGTSSAASKMGKAAATGAVIDYETNQ